MKLPGRLPDLDQAFRVAAAELGMCTAGWLFADALEADRGPVGLQQARDALGRTFPVFDAVLAGRLDGAQHPAVDAAVCAEACRGLKRLTVVGYEARFVDALLPLLPGVDVALLAHSSFDPDWDRLLSNYGGRVGRVSLDEYQRRAGPHAGLLTFVYGGTGGAGYVVPEWLRVSGEDVRLQFRSFVGWEVLGRGFYVYPRWLVEVGLDAFTTVVGA